MQNKVCIIVCYFGNLPEWFELWRKSASLNKEYNFLLVSDSDIKLRDNNIKVVKMSLQKFSECCSKKLNLKINLKEPYKLCDFKPVYGLIFEDYLKCFDFWGYCDLDQIWGNIQTFVNDTILNNYDKINWCGHFTLYRNNYEIRNMYKAKGAAYNYKKVFLQDYNYAFDELSGIDRIAKKQKIRQININCFLDIDRKYSEYRACNQKNYDKQIFCYHNGKVIQYYIDKMNNVKHKEFAYIHFQTKKPKVNIDLKQAEDEYIIIDSKGINKVNNVINKKIIEEFSEDSSKQKLRIENKKFRNNQIKKFIKMPMKKKTIRIKQAIYKKIKPF